MKKQRIDIIDIIRGFALLLIILIHFVESFEFYKLPLHHFYFSAETNRLVSEWVMLLVRGKAYSMFALLFGVSFYIQMNNKAQKGIDYRLGFAWRMFVLLCIGFLFSLIYRGDILHMYALFAFPVIFIYNLPSKWLLSISCILLLQLPLIGIICYGFYDNTYTFLEEYPYWFEGNELSEHGSLWDVIQFNFLKGRHTAWIWTFYVGRYLQIWALFIIGVLIGRWGILKDTLAHEKLLKKILLIAIPLVCVLHHIANSLVPKLTILDYQKHFLTLLVSSWEQLFGMLLFISALILLYHAKPKNIFFKLFKAYGKLSLTNYVSQGIIGVTLYYGFGFALWRYLGVTWSVLLGVIFFFSQAIFCIFWNKYFYYGPLEWVWRCLSDRTFNIPFRKAI